MKIFSEVFESRKFLNDLTPLRETPIGIWEIDETRPDVAIDASCDA